MNRTTILLAAILVSVLITSPSNAATWFQADTEEVECRSPFRKFLARLNGVPAFVVKCPGTEISVMDRIRNPGCIEVKCEPCGDQKDWLCRQIYVRSCVKVECDCLNGGKCVCEQCGTGCCCQGSCGATRLSNWDQAAKDAADLLAWEGDSDETQRTASAPADTAPARISQLPPFMAPKPILVPGARTSNTKIN